MNQKQIQELKAYLLEQRDAYYNDKPKTASGKPRISDQEYDAFEDRLVKFLPPDDEWFDQIGHIPSSGWDKEPHEIPMGSQNKINTEAEIIEFCDKEKTDKGYILEHKIDGFSLEFVYQTKSLEKAVTRGNGLIGENITKNARRFRDLPKIIPTDKRVKVRAEGLITKDNFQKILKSVDEDYKNARNAASGISRRYDGSHTQYVQVLFYDIEANVKTELEKLMLLEHLGFPVVKYYHCKTAQEIIQHYREYKNGKRDKLPYEIDGFVIKYNDIEIQKFLGVKNKRPLGQTALKFESDQAVTKVNTIALQVGRTGVITPLALLEPVDLMGSTISKATLHNFSEIKRLGLGEGDEVTIERGGDIIPKITEVVFSAGHDYKEPNRCPSCQGSVINDGVNIWCENEPCKEKDVNRINYWIKKLQMKDFSKKFIEKLYDQDKVKVISDLYKLTSEDFDSIDGVGEKTVKSFFKKLKDSSDMLLQEFISALGIPSCSDATATMLVSKFGSWDKINQLNPNDIIGIPGYKEKSATAICEGIQEIKSMADDLLKVIKLKQSSGGKLTGVSVCVTGELISMGREEFKKLIVMEGGEFKSSVSAGLTYLVTNDPDSGSSKNEKAKKFDVKVITEIDFFKNILKQNLPQPNVKDSGKTTNLEFTALF